MKFMGVEWIYDEGKREGKGRKVPGSLVKVSINESE